MDGNSPRYQTVTASCPECGRRVSQNGPFTVVRISEGEMESYHHFLEMCWDLETTANLRGRGNNGAPIITFPEYSGFGNLPDEDFLNVVTYLTSIPSLEAASIGFIIIIDRRRDKWSAVKASLTRIAGAFPGNLQLVLVLRPSRFIQRTITDISMKLHRDDFKMKIIMLNSVSDLHGYIDKNQLTCELGGTLDYCHNQWIHHRTAIENFAVTVKTTAQMLQMFGTDLAETELPNDVHCTEDLLVSHTEKHDKLKDDLQLAFKQGTTILSCIKERGTKNTSYKLNSDELENVATVERLEAASIGFIIIIDRRRDKWSAVKASLTRIAGAFPGNLQLVLVLRPSRFIQRTITDISMKLHRDDFKMKVPIIMLNSVSDLHGYIDKNQLTCELGGTLDYCHNQWIHHRTAIENFAVTVKTTAQMLQMFGTDLAETELPNDVHCTEDLLVSHIEKHDKLKAIENFAVTVKTTAQMLQMFGTDLAETELPNDVHCTEDLLVSHTEKHDKLKEPLEKAQLQALRGDQLIQSNHYAVDSIRPKCIELRRICDDFNNETKKKYDILGKSYEIHTKIDKVNLWCDTGIYLLASQAVDKCQSQEGAESALHDIEEFNETANENQPGSLKELHNQFEMILTSDVKANVQKALQRLGDVQEMIEKRQVSLKKLSAKQTRPVQPVAPRPESSPKRASTKPVTNAGPTAAPTRRASESSSTPKPPTEAELAKKKNSRKTRGGIKIEVMHEASQGGSSHILVTNETEESLLSRRRYYTDAAQNMEGTTSEVFTPLVICPV
ncbi:UNVERIFIED_CONTAM: hypothetical protein FKN15_023492 [Acipenser sinensis]